MRQRPSLLGVVLSGMVSYVAGCGGVHDAMRGDQPKASDVMGEASVQPVSGPSTPLVVDWKSEQRADLEEIVADGAIAIVGWDAKGFRLLRKCSLKGDYGYLPLSIKKDVVRFESKDEVVANLPLGGLGIIGKIGGEFDKGATLDIAMAMVGKRRTVLADVNKADLSGPCDEATHYVRAMTVGAFAMTTGTKAKASGSAEIFGASAGGSTGSSKDVSNSDGVLDDCEKATGQESKPLGKCGAVLRLELEPIGAGAAKKEKEHGKKEEPSKTPPQCPAGLVWAGEACVKAARKLPHACKELDGPDCKEQCDLGNAESCWQYGWYLFKAKNDVKGSIASYEKSCGAGFAVACFELGRLFENLNQLPPAATAFDKGCLLGSAMACRDLGDYFHQGLVGPKDDVKTAVLYTRACEGGDAWSCVEVGILYGNGGKGLKPDKGRALFYSKRGCLTGDKLGCETVKALMK